MEKKFSLSEFGYTAIVGKFAGQADGAVWLQQGGTVVIAAVVSEPTEEFPGFFPLTVDYRELFSAAGRIPGGYLKREGRPSDQEILNGRLIDRAIRPLFPEDFFDKVQLTTTIYSADKERMPQGLALLASSLALVLSPIPFMTPVGICEVARIDGQWIFDPTLDQAQKSDVRLIVAGNEEGVNMVEGSSTGISEEEFLDVMFRAHEYVKKQVLWQIDIQKHCGAPKNEVKDTFGGKLWETRATEFIATDRVAELFVADKVVRAEKQKNLFEGFKAQYKEEISSSGVSLSFVAYVFDIVLKKAINELVFSRGERIDLRGFETVRQISTEVGLLPCAHGSALFSRGRTQALVSVTLGGGQDRMRVEGLMGEKSKTFMLHYNFPSFSVGEVRPNRGPGRREIGHGQLAASAIERMLPDQEKFPYTIRIVSDILESDGSSSMATVCGTTMALMHAGVPLTSMVSGVAMGLLMSKEGKFQVVTDLSGVEDAFGFMDFKVAGTENGITAIQMDIKYKGGLLKTVFEQALAQAKRGRLHVMAEMKKVMSKPNEKMSDMVPQIVSFRIPRDKIGAVIGTGGKVIREITETTETSIDIEDEGIVRIFGQPGPLLDKAVSLVKVLAGVLDIGARYPGIVRRLTDFGIFVELAPGQDGLVHISTVPRKDQDEFMNRYRDGDLVTVEVLDHDKVSGRIRLKIVD
ncbi:MAG: Polyribonucleotide nucleotidyltransferase [candidate division TM6 bacterium GW2011_GWE2_42_60]|nr:MAG: Polyribonucleotide nucleotidyltransferase [candidate division TM6 bacterium GW2011_GWE2_42_60]HBY05691.1 polyribonucleotide nucleotidyltransferase [Candidatus Dependentiae bacterium]